MSELWLWFIRPIAEFLGAILLFAGLIGGFCLFVLIAEWRSKRHDRHD